MNNILQYFKEVRLEFSRIEWPGVTEWVGATKVVLLVVFLFTIYFAVVDQSFHAILRAIFKVSL